MFKPEHRSYTTLTNNGFVTHVTTTIKKIYFFLKKDMKRLNTSHMSPIKLQGFNICKGLFRLVRFNPHEYPRRCHIIQPFLHPCIISIHAEPARVIYRAVRKSNNVRFLPHRIAKTHGEFQKMTSHRWAFRVSQRVLLHL